MRSRRNRKPKIEELDVFTLNPIQKFILAIAFFALLAYLS